MKILLKNSSILFLLFIFFGNGACQQSEKEDKAIDALSVLDRMVREREKYTKDIQIKILKAKAEEKNSKTLQDRYNALRGLYELYRSYKIDSALIVADKRLETAQQINEKSKIISASLNLAEGYVLSGQPLKALNILDTLPTELMADHQLKYRNNIYLKAYSLKKNEAILSHERLKAIESLQNYRNIELKNKDKNSRGYLTLMAEQLKDSGMIDEAVAKMEDMANKYDISESAPLLYMMGETYLEAGKIDEAIEFLTQAAFLDISNGSKEYRALILLASALYQKGDLNRAFEYINCAFEDANFSKANLRTDEVMQIMPIISNAFLQQEKEIKQRNAWIIVTAVGFILILILFIILIIKSNHSKHKMIETIETMNKKLTQRNNQLIESSEIKLNILRDFLIKYARYIGNTKTFRKKLYRLIKGGQYQQAENLTRSNKDENVSFSDFQEMFDVAFLSIFPDFIEKLNQYLKIPMEKNENMRLSPEIRMVALMRLGITSTEEISEMFNYSSQSVYNLRSSLRNLINVNWEVFEKEVTKI